MKIYNRTKIPTPELAAVVKAAGRAIERGVKMTNVPIIIKARKAHTPWGQYAGMAYRCNRVRWSHLTGAKKSSNRWVNVDGGYFEVTIPNFNFADALFISESLFWIAAHEWMHIVDYQKNRYWDHNEARKKHDNRSWERRANSGRADAVLKSETDSTIQDIILNLALAIEVLKSK
jgi:hypothetical protein